jgi:hypothetical protein
MSTDILQHFDRVKQTGPNAWMVLNPLRPEQRTNSTSIRRADDRWLIHDFAGEDTAELLAAVGLTLSDLYDRPLDHHRVPVRDRRHRHAAAEALRSMAHESLVVVVAADNVAAGRHLEDGDRARLLLAAERIRMARDVAA